MAYEEATSASYVLRGTTPLAAGMSTVLSCSRSGKYKPNVQGTVRKRRLKSQGSCKLGFACTAALRVKVSAEGQVTVTVFPFHYGHGTDMADLPHLPLPSATRANAQGKYVILVDICCVSFPAKHALTDYIDTDTWFPGRCR